MGETAQITDVVQRVECEIYATVEHYRGQEKYSFIANYVAKATLALTVTQDGSVAPDTTLLGPWGSLSSLAIGGSLKASTERVATYAFTIKFSDAHRFAKACRDGTSRLHGTIGFYEWFTRVIASIDQDDTWTRPSDVSHKLEFQLDAGLKLTPAWQLTRFKGESGVAANLTFKNSVDFTMTYADPDAEDFQRVCVVNAPGPCREIAYVRDRQGQPGSKGKKGKAGKSISPPTISPAVRQQLNSNSLDLILRSREGLR